MNKILVADDDPDILGLVKIVLHAHNYVVQAVSRWQEINSCIETFRPDLLLLDVSLEGADGREICKKIKEARETKNLPVILFSANADMAKFTNECGAASFIAKPFEIRELLGSIQHFLN